MNKLEQNLGVLIDICHVNLKNSKKCLDYLQDRNINQEIIDKFKLGYFPQNVSVLGKHLNLTSLQKLQVINYDETSQFSDFYYLIFPLFSEYQVPVGIGGRCLLNEDERDGLGLAKYKNSSFKKSNFLYGFQYSKDEALQEKNIYVVEGYFDHLSLYSNNIKNSVAICGTAFTPKQFLKLAKYTEMMTFILDQDDAGKNAGKSIFKKFVNQGIKLRFLNLPNGCKDIDDYFKLGGSKENFQKDLDIFIPDWEF